MYAVDASDMAYHAKAIVERNGYGEVIQVLKGKVEEVELPEVDVIVSEW